MKKLLSLALAALLLCAASLSVAEEAMTPGTYTASGDGFGGKIVLNVTVDEKGVTAVEVVENAETPEFGGAALPKLVDEAVAGGAFSVDAVAGATLTSGSLQGARAA